MKLFSPAGLPLRVYDEVTGCNTLNQTDPHGYGFLDRCELPYFNTFIANNGYLDANSFNIYIPYAIGFGGASYYNNTKLIIRPNGMQSGSLIHEVGHSFNLRHTFDNYNSSSCERVTRDANDPLYNADTRGDLVIDTAAVPDFQREYCYVNGSTDLNCTGNSTYMSYGYIDTSNCSHIPGSRNFYNEEFEVEEEDVQNYMAYTPEECKNQFTHGQVIRMREAIANDVSGRFEQATTTIASLYEPYKGTYYFAGPLSTDIPLFQPGFNYRFVECSGNYPQPADYYDISFPSNNANFLLNINRDEQDFSSITHPNHSAIWIKHEDPAFSPQARKCYDNYNRAPKSGRSMLFNDGVFNTNVTVQEMDSLQINNPQMIDNLEPGLYKIEEDHDGGAKKETVILKEN